MTVDDLKASRSAASLFARPDLQAHYRADGSTILRSKLATKPAPGIRRLTDWLLFWAERAPDRPFLAERDAGGELRQVTYGQSWRRAASIAGSLAERQLDRTTPIVIVAENGIDHALFMFGAMAAGLPVAPVSTAYARLGESSSRWGHILDLVKPQMIFVDDPARYRVALQHRLVEDVELVVGAGEADGRLVTPFAALEDAAPIVGPLDFDNTGLAKVLFTSGSTGIPKGVINTHDMLLHSQDSLAVIWPFLEDGPLQLVDWLPWSHTFGGNHNLGLILRTGGFMLIDEGRPLPGMMERTIANLKAASPTVYFSVPRGYAMLLAALEQDEALQLSFFDQLRLMFYSGASLPQPLWEGMAELSARARGEHVAMTTSWGSTETAPLATSAHFPLDRPGNIGVPVPGCAIKLAPVDGRLEIRCKGANITPGYFRNAAATQEAFDAEGWLRSGDAVRLVDPARPELGLVFDGRIAESFKLLTGTWVNVGPLRTAVVAHLSPLIDDCVVAGHDRDDIGLLLFPNAAAMRAVVGGSGVDVAELVRHPEISSRVRQGLVGYNRQARGSSTRVARALLLVEPASLGAGELTDKGYINQRAVLERRSRLVEALFANSQEAHVIVPDMR